ncbi:MAG: hypothetical protein Q9182_004261 [Xanthomendoza sp. 2 TL-2023]
MSSINWMQVGSRAPCLLRSHSPLLVFLAPSVSSKLPVAAVRLCPTYLAIANAFHSQPILRQASSPAAAPKQPSPEDDPTPSNTDTLLKPQRRNPEDIKRRQTSLLDMFRNPSRNAQPSMSDEDRARRMDDLLGVRKPPQSTTSNDPSAPTTQDGEPGESTADMVARMRAETRRRDFAAAQEQRSRQGSIVRGMQMPPMNPAQFQQDMFPLEEPTRAVATIKSRPSLGRSVEVMPERGVDLGRALRSLDINCAYNNVRNDSHSQRFYERPGLKRKRLRSVRWRKNFKTGFKAIVSKVKAMRRKGW